MDEIGLRVSRPLLNRLLSHHLPNTKFVWVNSNPNTLKLGGILSLSAFLTACGGGGGTSSATSPPSPSPQPTPQPTNSQPPSPPPTDQASARFLQQAQFSSTLAEIAVVREMGFEKWLNTQLTMPIGEKGYDWLYRHREVFTRTVEDEENFSGSWGSHSQPMIWYQLITQPDTLRKRVALALSEIFVVSFMGTDIRYCALAIANFWDILNRHAFGNYRALLEAVTLSSAMGSYLNTLGNKKADPSKGSQADENYAREVLQLFSIGLVELNLDGTPKLTTTGQPIETYNLKQVAELAKVFTGYQLAEVKHPWKATAEIHTKPMVVEPTLHDNTSKQIFGTLIPANTSPSQALSMALDSIANHANVAPFICKQLIQRLITSNPSPAYVARVANVFNNNGQGVRSDLGAVVKAILLDTEARTPPTSSFGGKVREPMISFVQWVRTLTTKQSISGNWLIGSLGHERWAIGQSPFASPSVFNFFRPNYRPSGTEFEVNQLSAPELYLIHENSIAGYQNFFLSLANRGVDSKDNWQICEIANDYGDLLSLANDPTTLVNRLNLILTAESLSPSTVSYILQAVNSIGTTVKDWQKQRVAVACWMTMISPDYRVQK
ncbi:MULTISPECIES: DUF1800 domain-containing protein [unclassified Moraxella]|uniref:DUF1800 domain-containing protein n=1 Tax=unclassified Moraxella TaxID=2685852 RepID=UPI003AF9051F